MQPRDTENSWISERNCSICKGPVGHGKFRPKRLKCKVCEKTVCPTCSSQQTEGVICRSCGGEDPGPEEPREQSRETKGRSSELGAEDLLASAKDILADIKAKQTQHAPEKRAEILNTSNSIIEKYQSQIIAYDSEIQDMKKQIDWYAEQLDKREQTIQQMSGQMTTLSANNQLLDERINTLEALLGRFTEAKPDERHPETRSGECVKCVLF